MPDDEPRERLIAAMAAGVRERGFLQTTIAHVVAEAHVSRRTFYEHFENPLACYIAVLERVADATAATITAAVAKPGTASERIDRAVRGYLDALERDPRLMRSFLRELHLTGEPGQQLLRRANRQMGETISALVEEARRTEPELGLEPVPVALAQLVAGGIAQAALVAQDEGAGLDEVRLTADALVARVVGGVLRG